MASQIASTSRAHKSDVDPGGTITTFCVSYIRILLSVRDSYILNRPLLYLAPDIVLLVTTKASYMLLQMEKAKTKRCAKHGFLAWRFTRPRYLLLNLPVLPPLTSRKIKITSICISGPLCVYVILVSQTSKPYRKPVQHLLVPPVR